MAQRKEFKTDLVFNGRVNPSLNKATNSIMRSLRTISGTLLATAGIASVGMAFNTVKEKVLESVEAGKAQVEAETKLRAALANNLELRRLGTKAQNEAFEVLSKQASSLQKIGVVGDEVALAGMQQLASYQLSAQQIKALSSGMNDMLVKQYGLNATQENAVAVAKLIGRALTGNAGALKRYGIVATAAEEKMLKNGNQAQRVAVLTKLLERNVGGVNKALAATPQGKIQQANNLWSDMQEEIGIKLMPVLAELATSTVGLIPYVQNLAFAAINAITPIAQGLSNIGQSITDISNFISSVAQPALIALSGIIAGLVTFKTIQAFQMLQVQMALATKEAGIMGMVVNGNLVGALKAMTTATWSSVRAIAAQTAALLANPITWIVLGVAALTAGLVALALNWDKVTNAVKKAAQATANFLHLNGKSEAPKVQVNQSNQPQKHNALGTNSFVGGSTWVGEHGPEYVSIPRGASISSNNRSMGAMGNVSMPITININGNADANTMKNAVSDIMPNIKAQIDAYFREKQRRGVSFA